jgi:hypothetical protein
MRILSKSWPGKMAMLSFAITCPFEAAAQDNNACTGVVASFRATDEAVASFSDNPDLSVSLLVAAALSTDAAGELATTSEWPEAIIAAFAALSQRLRDLADGEPQHRNEDAAYDIRGTIIDLTETAFGICSPEDFVPPQ